jgi:DNA polymerase/3'-5' exonuclease PolX
MIPCLKYHSFTEDRYRSLAYEKAIASLRALPYDVQSISELTETIDLGAGILTTIDDLLTKGN